MADSTKETVKTGGISNPIGVNNGVVNNIIFNAHDIARDLFGKVLDRLAVLQIFFNMSLKYGAKVDEEHVMPIISNFQGYQRDLIYSTEFDNQARHNLGLT